MTVNRVQLALNVAELDTAIDFYRRMFGVEVHKRRSGYANFAIADPPLKLVLFEAPDAGQQLNHLGVEVATSDEVAAAAARFEAAGLPSHTSERERCCHAVQDKVYVQAPDVPLGHWEFYAIVDDDPADTTATDKAASCCEPDAQDSGCCAAAPAISPADQYRSGATAGRHPPQASQLGPRREGARG